MDKHTQRFVDTLFYTSTLLNSVFSQSLEYKNLVSLRSHATLNCVVAPSSVKHVNQHNICM
jgi:hypothetical protein